MTEISKDDIVALECKNVFYARSKYDPGRDAVIIKERVHLKDGRTEPRVVVKVNPKRKFYISKKGVQKTHKQKRLFESLDNVHEYTTTQANLTRDIARAMGNPGFNPGLKKLAESPYLYGTDVSMRALAKMRYIEKAPDAITPNSVAVLDIETDIDNGNENVLCCSLTMKNKVILAVWKPFVEGHGDQETLQRKVRDACWKYIPNAMKTRKINVEVVLCDKPGQCAEVCFKRAHEWKPDFVAIWNINFDLPIILENAKRDGVDMEAMFSDPSVPEEFRFFDYTEDSKTHETANGTKRNKAPHEQWHRFNSSAGFYVIDAMAVYYTLRMAAGKEPGYSLDAVLDRRLGKRKLKFKEADAYVGGLWHSFMQKNFKIEYLVYNIWDCVSVEELDEQEKDLSTSISILCKQNEYDLFPRQPKRTAFSLHFYSLKKNHVIASSPPQIEVEDDGHVVSTEGWIITLPTQLTADNGLFCLKDYPLLRSYARSHVYDLDVSSAYPNGGVIFNISKETTLRELCQVAGIRESVKRRASINLTMPQMNAMEIAQDILNAPDPLDLLEAYERDRVPTSNVVPNLAA